MLLWAAHAHLGWAEALAARGEADRAREEAQRALELSREHGYALFEPRAATLVETESPAGARRASRNGIAARAPEAGRGAEAREHSEWVKAERENAEAA
jgi:hypothetical protein